MVLVDTSVWIRALAGKRPYRHELDRLLAHGDVLAHEYVYGELLIGDRAGSRAKILATYALFESAPTVAHVEVVELVTARRLHGRGIGWIDAQLLASSLVAETTLYTADAALAEIAAELGIAHAQ